MIFSPLQCWDSVTKYINTVYWQKAMQQLDITKRAWSLKYLPQQNSEIWITLYSFNWQPKSVWCVQLMCWADHINVNQLDIKKPDILFVFADLNIQTHTHTLPLVSVNCLWGS